MQVRRLFRHIADAFRCTRCIAAPRALAALLLCATAGCAKTPAVTVPGGDAARGKETIRRYGCGACHAIPGFASQGSNAGPPLAGIARRGYLAGVLPNTPQQMVRWLRDPPQVAPRTAMPVLGVSEAEARDIAAYLYTLE